MTLTVVCATWPIVFAESMASHRILSSRFAATFTNRSLKGPGERNWLWSSSESWPACASTFCLGSGCSHCKGA